MNRNDVFEQVVAQVNKGKFFEDKEILKQKISMVQV